MRDYLNDPPKVRLRDASDGLPLPLMKRQPEYRFNLEQHTKEAIERKYQCEAKMQEAMTGTVPKIGVVTLFKFDLKDAARTIVYAWNEPREQAWAPPKTMIFSETEMTSGVAGIEFLALPPS